MTEDKDKTASLHDTRTEQRRRALAIVVAVAALALVVLAVYGLSRLFGPALS